MSIFAATGWTFGVMFLLVAMMEVATLLREAARLDLVTMSFAQLIANGLVLFAILRIYAPDASVRRFLALRPTSFGIYPLALLLGASITLPMDKVLELVLERWPRAEGVHIQDMLESATALRRVVLGVLIGVVAPVVEEVFFRGALFVPLRRFAQLGGVTPAPAGDDAAERSSAPTPSSASLPPRPSASSVAWTTIAATTLLFVVSHLEWQIFLPLAVVATLMGLFRQRSGSIVPAILVHVGLNSTSVLMTYSLPNLNAVPWSWAAGGAAVATACAVGILMLCRGERAAAARAEEL